MFWRHCNPLKHSKLQRPSQTNFPNLLQFACFHVTQHVQGTETAWEVLCLCICQSISKYAFFCLRTESYLWALLRVCSIREAYRWMRCSWKSCCCIHTNNPTAITTATTGSTCDANILMWHCTGRRQIWHWWGRPVLARTHGDKY